jgi:Predicted membrane protein
MKLKHTQLQIFLEIAGAALIAGMAIFLVLSWNSFPDRIPTHFNAFGQVDAWGSHQDLLFLPILGIGIYALITILTFFPAVWNVNIRYKAENKEAVYQAIKTMMMVLKIELLGLFLFIFYFMATAQNLPGYFMPVFLAAIFVPVVLFILHARKVGNKQEGDY